MKGRRRLCLVGWAVLLAVLTATSSGTAQNLPPRAGAPSPIRSTVPALQPEPPAVAADDADRAGRPEPHPIDLPTALRLADANNPTVGLARARAGEALAQLDRARLAWIPNLSFGPTFFYHGGIDQNRRGDTFIVDRGYYSLGVGPTLRVDLSDALYLPLVARQGVRAANSLVQATANATQLDVAIAYLDLLELYALMAINADILDRTEQVLRAAQSGAKAGAGRATDVNRAATEVNLRREEGIALRGRAAAASARLTRLLLLDPSVQLIPHELVVLPLILVPGETTVEQLIQTGLRARPEVAVAQAGLAAADAQLRQSKVAPLLPRVQADFIAGGLSGGRGDDFSPFQNQYNTGVALVWNVDNFGLGNAAAVRGRRAGYAAAQFRLQEVQALVSSQVVEAAETAGARFDTLEPAQEAVRQAEEMYRKFRATSFGMVGPKAQFDALEPLTAIQALNAARVQYLQQVVEFNRAEFRLYAAIGQPAVSGLPTAVPQATSIPVVPAMPNSAKPDPVPDPRPVPPPPDVPVPESSR